MGEVGANIEPTYIHCTHKDLVDIRDSSKLIPGAFYRITDYECITTQADTRSANHPFDIIVQALDERTLSENAHAVAREGDDYFANCNLGAWQLKYTIDNDTTRHSWAKVEVLEQPQKWECGLGTLLESYDEDATIAPTRTDIVDGVMKYLYRPAEPTSYLDNKEIYEMVASDTITSTKGFTYEADSAPSINHNVNWDGVDTIRVETNEGQLIATLIRVDNDHFYEESDYENRKEYDLYFYWKTTYDEDENVYIYSMPDIFEDLWEFEFKGKYPNIGLEDLRFVSNNEPYIEENVDWDVGEIRVKTAYGKLVTTLFYDGDGCFVDENDKDGEYGIHFGPYPDYDEEKEVYSYEVLSGISDWWQGVYHGTMIMAYEKSVYKGSKSALYYSFDAPLTKKNEYVYKVYSAETRKEYVYGENIEKSTYVDYISYVSYIAAQEEGKGVIYEMVDEHNNHCPYDFKNMQFCHEEECYYTFSFNGNDLSLTDYCVDNYIHTNRKPKFNYTTTPVPNSIPMVIFDAKPNPEGKTFGIIHNSLEVPITKGYISARRIENFVWKSKLNSEAVKTLYINTINICSGNTIYGCASTFTVGSSSVPTTTFYDNEIHLSAFQTNAFKCDAATFVNNKLDLAKSSAGFAITAGSITSCNITNTYNNSSDEIQFEAHAILRDCVIKMNQALTIKYVPSTATTEPLRFLNIDARGLSESTITIDSKFPANSPYELKVAEDSQGNVMMWREVDFVKAIAENTENISKNTENISKLMGNEE